MPIQSGCFKGHSTCRTTPSRSFFPWGPRQTGKSRLLRETYPRARWIDLLRSDDLIRYTERPALLREELLANPESGRIVIDEIQKVPALLDVVRWLIENRRVVFAICGSSARRLRRGHANLLGGRALRFELSGLVSQEIGRSFDLVRALNHGYLPAHYLEDDAMPLLRAYVNDDLREEVLAEGLVRRLQPFSDFLRAAALADGELVNYSTIARDCGVSPPTVAEYFRILADTLVGRFLPAWTKRPKRRVVATPKFHFSDVGVVDTLARRGRIEPKSELFGKAFENGVHHKLVAWLAYRDGFADLSYWRLASGTEVDFIVGDPVCGVEAKATARVHSDHFRGLRELAREHPRLARRIVVALESRARRTEVGIDVLPAREFAERLWAGDLIPEAGHASRPVK